MEEDINNISQTIDTEDLETENVPVQDPEQASSEPIGTENPTHKNSIRKFFERMVKGNRLLIALIVVLCLILVGTRYYVEKQLIIIKDLQEEVNELRIRQIQMKCDYMQSTMLNEVSKKLEPLGIKEGRTPSNKITIGKSENTTSDGEE